MVVDYTRYNEIYDEYSAKQQERNRLDEQVDKLSWELRNLQFDMQQERAQKILEEYKEKGLPRVRVDNEIHSVEDFAMFNASRFNSMISMDNDTSIQEHKISWHNQEAYKKYKETGGTIIERLLRMLGGHSVMSMEEIWTVEGSQGQCERVIVYPGLTDEQLRELGVI